MRLPYCQDFRLSVGRQGPGEQEDVGAVIAAGELVRAKRSGSSSKWPGRCVEYFVIDTPRPR